MISIDSSGNPCIYDGDMHSKTVGSDFIDVDDSKVNTCVSDGGSDKDNKMRNFDFTTAVGDMNDGDKNNKLINTHIKDMGDSKMGICICDGGDDKSNTTNIDAKDVSDITQNSCKL